MVDEFYLAFVKIKDGQWLCRRSVEIIGPYGANATTPGETYVSGEKFLGKYDVAAWLDSMAATGKSPVGIKFL